MLRYIVVGATAGAVGTVALNITTYLDMAIRGRAGSSMPADLAATLADKLGIDLATDSNAETAQHRRTALGALMGYVTGLGVGAVYGLVRPHMRTVPLPIAGIGTAMAAMAASDVPATILGVTDPTSWRPSDWAMDFGFHLAYGLTTVIAYDALLGPLN